MDIINVLKSELTSQIDLAAFEINSVLADPTKKDAIDRLSIAIAKYTRKIAEVETLTRLQSQAQAANQGETQQQSPEGS